MKKLLLSLSLIALNAVAAFAQTIVKVDGILYTVSDGKAEVGRQDKSLAGDVVIPPAIIYEGSEVPVKSIVAPTSTTFWSDNTVTCEGGAFQDCENMTSITILADISKIPFGCFYDCHLLTSASIPQNVSVIGPGAFANCTNLTEVVIPNSVAKIDTYTFGNCNSLKSIVLSDNVMTISNGAFKNSGLMELALPESVSYIGDQSLSIPSLKNLKVAYRSLTSIDCSLIAFENVSECTLLHPRGTLNLYRNTEPWSFFTIYEEYDDGIGDITEYDKEEVLIDGLRYWIHYADRYAEVGRQDATLEGDIVVPDYIDFKYTRYPVTSIIEPIDLISYSDGSAIAKGGAFQNTKISSISLPSGITCIPVGAFQGCANLTRVDLPESMKVIECAAFADCTHLAEIALPEGLEELGSASFGYGYKSYVFGGCGNLTTVKIPSKITRIGQGAFLNSGLKSLELSEDIDRIEFAALKGTAMESLIIHRQDVRELRYTDSSFGDVSGCILYIPLGAKYLYQEFYPWIDFAEIIEINEGQAPFEPDVKVARIDGVRYFLHEDFTASVQRQNIDLEGDIEIPEMIEHDGHSYTVSSIVGPTDITAWSSNTVSTESGAFQNCSIRSIVLPATIHEIPAGAFFDCSRLEDVSLPSELTEIGAAAFANCIALEQLFVPESVTAFGSNTIYGFISYVFGNCKSLKKINIPSSFTDIPEACFKNSGLSTMLITEGMNCLKPGCFELPNLQFVKIKHPYLNNLKYTESIFPDDLSNVTLLVPKDSKEIYSNFYPWKKFKTIEEYEKTADSHDFNAYGFTLEVVVESDEADGADSKLYEPKLKETLISESHKDYVPSGKHLDWLSAGEIDGYEFLGWENLQSFMPGEDLTVRAIYRKINTFVSDVSNDENVAVKSIYTPSGIYAGDNPEALPNGIYIVRYNDDSVKKISVGR